MKCFVCHHFLLRVRCSSIDCTSAFAKTFGAQSLAAPCLSLLCTVHRCLFLSVSLSHSDYIWHVQCAHWRLYVLSFSAKTTQLPNFRCSCDAPDELVLKWKLHVHRRFTFLCFFLFLYLYLQIMPSKLMLPLPAIFFFGLVWFGFFFCLILQKLQCYLLRKLLL